MRPEEPDPVKLFHGILFSEEEKLVRAREELIRRFGPVDYESPRFPFRITSYYEVEMGAPIYRIFLSHEPLIHPGRLAGIKIQSNEIEEQLAVNGRRKVNIDSGYMDVCKVVLASAKYNGQKIYLDQGIYADLTLYYRKGEFFPYPWSFPDFRTGMYTSAFLRIRERYKVQHKRWFHEYRRTVPEDIEEK